MDSMQAFANGEANHGKELMVFDWEKAVNLINENGYKNCGAGLKDDYGWTAGNILTNGKPVTNDYTYLASTWATPQLIVCSDDGYEIVHEIDCFVMQSETSWGSDTKFPEDQQKRLK